MNRVSPELQGEMTDFYLGENIFNIGLGVGLVPLLNDPTNTDSFSRLRRIRFTQQAYICDCVTSPPHVTVQTSCPSTPFQRPPITHRKPFWITADVRRVNGHPWFFVAVRSCRGDEDAAAVARRKLEEELKREMEMDDRGWPLFPNLEKLTRTRKDACWELYGGKSATASGGMEH